MTVDLSRGAEFITSKFSPALFHYLAPVSKLLIQMSSGETREVQTVHKNVEKMPKSGVNVKISYIFIVTARLARRLARLLQKSALLFVSNQTYSCTCIFSAIRITIVIR